jgi:membrane fusion protein (multidrug efflux system)
MGTKFFKRTFILALVLSLIGFTAFRIFMNGKIEEMKRKGFITGAIPVEFIHPVERPLQNKINVIGNLLSSESVTLKPEIPGRITKIAFVEGLPLKKGDLCVAIDDEIYKAEVIEAKANLALSQKNLARAQTLLSKQAGSEFTRDTSLRDVEVNKARLDLAETNLRKTKIAAPFDGIVGFRKTSLGAYTSVGEEIVTIESIDPIKVEFKLPEFTLSYLKPGQKIQLSVDAFPGEIFLGELYAIDPKLDVRDRSVSVKAQIPNADYRLKPGLFARLQLTLSEKEQSLFLPDSALVSKGQDNFVFTMLDGKAHMVQVKTGLRDGQDREILDGITKEMQIVATGQHKLFEGLPIVAQKIAENRIAENS